MLLSVGHKAKPPARGNAPSSGGGITLGTPVASTSGAAIDFTGLPAGVKRITINFKSVSLNSADLMLIQLGDSGGIETAGYISGCWDGAFAASTAGFLLMRAGSAAYIMSGTIILSLENSTNWTWCCEGVLLNEAVFCNMCSGIKATSAQTDRVRITSNGAGTFDGGEINISWE
jgi:hypothetical protein